MKQAIYGSILLIFLMLPPVINLAESIMAIHMHMQMPLIAVGGILITPLLQKKFPRFFEKWNPDGVPGIVLFLIVTCYWLIPKAMDDALASNYVEIFKFISWSLFVGVPLRDSWPKLNKYWKHGIFVGLAILYTLMAGVYIFAPEQLCNNYLIVDQRTLGWSYLLIAMCLLLYFIQSLFIDPSDYEAEAE